MSTVMIFFFNFCTKINLKMKPLLNFLTMHYKLSISIYFFPAIFFFVTECKEFRGSNAQKATAVHTTKLVTETFFGNDLIPAPCLLTVYVEVIFPMWKHLQFCVQSFNFLSIMACKKRERERICDKAYS